MERKHDRVAPETVAEVVADLEQMSDRDFREALADNITDPVAEETEAFRSPALAFRSYAATRALIESTNSVIRAREGESDRQWRRRAEEFRTAVGMERRLLELIVAGERARRGVTAAAPNPTSRALRELARNHPVEFVALKRKHREAIAEEARAKKAERRRRR